MEDSAETMSKNQDLCFASKLEHKFANNYVQYICW